MARYFLDMSFEKAKALVQKKVDNWKPGEELNLEHLGLSVLPEIPEGVEELNCRYNMLTKIPKLPSSIKYLNIGCNMISSIDYNDLPEGLEYLSCHNNSLTKMPPRLPISLKILIVCDNKITELPEGLCMSYLEYFRCRNNSITTITNLPVTLKSLYCCYNPILRFDGLPDNLKTLMCTHCGLREITCGLPRKLKKFDCSNNKLTSLPLLPSGLKSLDCNDNFLHLLPALPNTLEWLLIQNNRLYDLPHMVPCSLNTIYSNGNSFPRPVRGEKAKDYYMRVLEAASAKRIVRRCKKYKLELIERAWHPLRVSKWIEAGLDLNDL